MDLQLYGRVLWRFRIVVMSGLVLALALAGLSFLRVGKGGFEYREHEEWASYATLLVGGPDFSLSSSIDPSEEPSVQAQRLAARQAALQQYTTFAIVYSKLADSDAVLGIVRRAGPLRGRIEAAAITTSEQDSDALPLISIAAVSDSAERARSLAEREVAALQEHLAAEQQADGVPTERRVSFTPVKKAQKAVLLTGRSLTLPIVVFLTVMIAVIALAFVLENLRPRVRTVRNEVRDNARPDPERRTA